MEIILNWFKRTFSDPQVVLLGVIVIGILLTINFMSGMLAPVIAAIVIAFLLDGPTEWLKRRGLPHILSVITVFITFIVLAVLVMILGVPPLADQIGDFFKEVPRMITSLQGAIIELQARFPEYISPDQIKETFASLGSEAASQGANLVSIGLSGVTSTLTIAVYLILVPVMVFFFLKDKVEIFAFMKGFMPNHRGLAEKVWYETVSKAGDYARGKVYEIIIVGTVALIVFNTIGIKYAALLAVVTGLSVIIPYIGATVITIPVALVAVFQWGLGSDFAIAVGAYLVIQALDGNVLAPLLFSEVVKLHPNAIILAILVFGGFWGLWGVFFAIPLATVVDAILRSWRQHTKSVEAEPSGNEA